MSGMYARSEISHSASQTKGSKMSDQITEVFAAYVDNGWSPKDAPDKVFYAQFPDVWKSKDTWEVYINGNDTPRTVSSKLDGGMTDFLLPCYDSAVFYNGWLAGTIGPFDGALLGEPGSESHLIDSIRAAKASA